MAKISIPGGVTRALIKANPNLCFYKMDGQWQVRTKSALTRKRVKKDPAFQLTRAYAAILATAAPMASRVLAQIAPANKVKGLYHHMLRTAMKALKEGMAEEAVADLLEKMFLPVTPLAIAPPMPEMLTDSRSQGIDQKAGMHVNTKGKLIVNNSTPWAALPQRSIHFHAALPYCIDADYVSCQSASYCSLNH